MFAIRDDTPLLNPTMSLVTGGQLHPGLLLYACSMTQGGKTLLGVDEIQKGGIAGPVQDPEEKSEDDCLS